MLLPNFSIEKPTGWSVPLSASVAVVVDVVVVAAVVVVRVDVNVVAGCIFPVLELTTAIRNLNRTSRY